MKPIRRARYFVFARSLIFVSGTPSMNTSPSLRSSRPLRQFRRVVLPHPEGPITATISPLRMSRSMPRSAWTETAPELYTLWAFTARTMTSSSAMCVQIREGGVYLAFWRVLSHAARLGKQVYHGPSEKYRTGPDRAGRCGGLLRADGVQVEVPVHFEAGTPGEPAQRLRQLRGAGLPGLRRHPRDLRLERAPREAVVQVRLRRLEDRPVSHRDRGRVTEARRSEDLRHPATVPEGPEAVARAGELVRGPQRRELPRRGRGLGAPGGREQRGRGRGVRELRPLREHEPARGLQDPRDLAEAPVRPEVRDPKVAHDAVEEPAAVHDVPDVHHLETDRLDPEDRRAVRGRREGPVREVDRDDTLGRDLRREQAREETRARPEVQEQLAGRRPRELEDLLRDRAEVRGDVPVVRLRHPAVLVREEQDDLLRVHGSGANGPEHLTVDSAGEAPRPPRRRRPLLSLTKDNRRDGARATIGLRIPWRCGKIVKGGGGNPRGWPPSSRSSARSRWASSLPSSATTSRIPVPVGSSSG